MASTRQPLEQVLTRFIALHNVEVIFLPQTVHPASRTPPWLVRVIVQIVRSLGCGSVGVGYNTQT
jgi:hypothetical protein